MLVRRTRLGPPAGQPCAAVGAGRRRSSPWPSARRGVAAGAPLGAGTHRRRGRPGHREGPRRGSQAQARRGRRAAARHRGRPATDGVAEARAEDLAVQLEGPRERLGPHGRPKGPRWPGPTTCAPRAGPVRAARHGPGPRWSRPSASPMTKADIVASRNHFGLYTPQSPFNLADVHALEAQRRAPRPPSSATSSMDGTSSAPTPSRTPGGTAGARCSRGSPARWGAWGARPTIPSTACPRSCGPPRRLHPR